MYYFDRNVRVVIADFVRADRGYCTKIIFVFAICLIKNKKTRNAISKAALAISSVCLAFFSLFIYLTIAARLH